MTVEIPGQSSVIGRYGSDTQAMVHMEECAELIQAISKMRRVRNKGADDSEAYYNLVEEIADVLICIEQMKVMYEIPNHEIQSMVFEKCARQEARLYDVD